MEQTAVEWLFEQMPKKLHPHYKKQLEQAKEMEKEQIINAFEDGCTIYDGYQSSEQYYNETYGTKG